MGNTASDRVAGERHGAKAARAEGAGGPGPGKEHKIMVGSTDDPSVFSLPDAKVSEPTPPAGGDPAAARAPLVQVTVFVNSGGGDVGWRFLLQCCLQTEVRFSRFLATLLATFLG